jgi:OmpA-OmpF porin, OOP family
MNRRSILMIGGLLGAMAIGAEEIQDFGQRVPNEEEFIEALSPAPDAAGGLKMRGIKPVPAARPEAPRGASMALKFDFNSATLSASAKQILDKLGAALQNERLEGYRFQIEGHTDSKGSAVYNKRLSERRALAVKEYLVERFQIAPERLRTIGRGKEAPLIPEDPENPANRRVQIINAGQ